MVDRQEVEALLEACERDRIGPHPDNDTLAALCRAWLAVEDAPEAEVREASFSDGHRVGKLIATTDQSMIGQRVRIVKEGE